MEQSQKTAPEPFAIAAPPGEYTAKILFGDVWKCLDRIHRKTRSGVIHTLV